MTVEAACRNASGTQAMYDMCKEPRTRSPAWPADPEIDHDATVLRGRRARRPPRWPASVRAT
uniref:Pectinesterase inhibitor domain-containing protein n=1 Tax=Oryza meridionalis TaxID=40149 RepID=A0A0E0EHR3_9ORYZ